MAWKDYVAKGGSTGFKARGSLKGSTASASSYRPEGQTASQQIRQIRETGSAINKEGLETVTSNNETIVNNGISENKNQVVEPTRTQDSFKENVVNKNSGKITGVNLFESSVNKQGQVVYRPTGVGIERESVSDQQNYELAYSESPSLVSGLKRTTIVTPVNKQTVDRSIQNYPSDNVVSVQETRTQVGKPYVETLKSNEFPSIFPKYTGSIRSGGVSKEVYNSNAEFGSAVSGQRVDVATLGSATKNPIYFARAKERATGTVNTEVELGRQVGEFVIDFPKNVATALSTNKDVGLSERSKSAAEVTTPFLIGSALSSGVKSKPAIVRYKSGESPYDSWIAGEKVSIRNQGNFIDTERGSVVVEAVGLKSNELYSGTYTQKVVGRENVFAGRKQDVFEVGQTLEVKKVKFSDEGVSSSVPVASQTVIARGVSGSGKVVTIGKSVTTYPEVKSPLVENTFYYGKTVARKDGRQFVEGISGVYEKGSPVVKSESFSAYKRTSDITSQGVNIKTFEKGSIASEKGGSVSIKRSKMALSVSDPVTATLISVERPKTIFSRGGVAERYSPNVEGVVKPTLKPEYFLSYNAGVGLSSGISKKPISSFRNDFVSVSEVKQNAFQNNLVSPVVNQKSELGLGQVPVVKQRLEQRQVPVVKQRLEQKYVSEQKYSGGGFGDYVVTSPSEKLPPVRPFVFNTPLQDSSKNKKGVGGSSRKYGYSASFAVYAGEKFFDLDFKNQVKQGFQGRFSGFEVRGFKKGKEKK